jgi:hypothetical protein
MSRYYICFVPECLVPENPYEIGVFAGNKWAISCMSSAFACMPNSPAIGYGTAVTCFGAVSGSTSAALAIAAYNIARQNGCLSREVEIDDSFPSEFHKGMFLGFAGNSCCATTFSVADSLSGGTGIIGMFAGGIFFTSCLPLLKHIFGSATAQGLPLIDANGMLVVIGRPLPEQEIQTQQPPQQTMQTEQQPPQQPEIQTQQQPPQQPDIPNSSISSQQLETSPSVVVNAEL